jgi:uncharacterized membrane protein YheB (UPF0754 family)
MYPVEFTGLGGIGWQGVIPANSKKMAQIVVTHSLERVITQKELISRIKPAEMVRALTHRIDPLVEEVVDEVMAQTSNYGIHVSNFFWSAAPVWVKDKFYQEVRNKLPEVAEKIIGDVAAEMDELLDINALIAENLGNNKRMLIDVFMKSAAREFSFIQNSGLYFGFPLGIPVMFAWYFFPVWWLLPLFGLFVGYITNKLALYLVQKPLNPKKIGPFTFQGLFIKRQKEVSRYYGQLFADKLVTAEALTNEVLKKEEALSRIQDLIYREVSHAIEASQGPLKPLTVLSMGPKEYVRLNHIVTNKTFEELKHPDKRSLSYINKAFDIEETIAERVGNLPPEEFFELLHPIIEEDEWKLIAVGAALGFAAGIWQWMLLT